MKPLAVAVIFLASSPAYSCPFHEAVFEHFGYSSEPAAASEIEIGKNQNTNLDNKRQASLNLKHAKAQLMLWKQGFQPMTLKPGTLTSK